MSPSLRNPGAAERSRELIPRRIGNVSQWAGANGPYAARIIATVFCHPREGIDRFRGRIEVARSPAREPWLANLQATEHWEERTHAIIAEPWPCSTALRFQSAWDAQARSFEEDVPLGASHDADRALASVVWCLVAHLQPECVVETGVARGVLSGFILQALEQNRKGHLWSIDLPPLMPGLEHASGVAVAPTLRHRWTFIRGASRRKLPALLRRVGAIDAFVHDSLHTEANMRFEFDQAWPALRPGGVLVCDDATANAAFLDFVEAGQIDFVLGSCSNKPGKFGIAIKSADKPT